MVTDTFSLTEPNALAARGGGNASGGGGGGSGAGGGGGGAARDVSPLATLTVAKHFISNLTADGRARESAVATEKLRVSSPPVGSHAWWHNIQVKIIVFQNAIVAPVLQLCLGG